MSDTYGCFESWRSDQTALLQEKRQAFDQAVARIIKYLEEHFSERYDVQLTEYSKTATLDLTRDEQVALLDWIQSTFDCIAITSDEFVFDDATNVHQLAQLATRTTK